MFSPVSVRSLILRILEIAEKASGVDIINSVRRQTDGKVELSTGSIYPVLRSLEDEGLVVAMEGPDKTTKRGRPRILYALTATGQEEASRNTSIVEEMWQERPKSTLETQKA